MTSIELSDSQKESRVAVAWGLAKVQGSFCTTQSILEKDGHDCTMINVSMLKVTEQ